MLFALFACSVNAATEQNTQTVAAVLSTQHPELVQRFVVESEQAERDLNVIIELGATAPTNPVEHHFEINIECVECGGTLKQTRFASFPAGSSGNYIFTLRREDIALHAQARDVILNVSLKLHINATAGSFSVPVTLCLTSVRINQCT